MLHQGDPGVFKRGKHHKVIIAALVASLLLSILPFKVAAESNATVPAATATVTQSSAVATNTAVAAPAQTAAATTPAVTSHITISPPSVNSATTLVPSVKPTPISPTTMPVSTAKSSVSESSQTQTTAGSTTSSATAATAASETNVTEPSASASPTPSVSPTPIPTPIPVDDSLTGLSSSGIASKKVRWSGSRLEAPPKTDEKFLAANPFAKAGFPMPNCTTYVYGRIWELLGERPLLSGRDANTFWGHNYRQKTYAFGQEPKLGAIACWNPGEFGHVAVVEDVSANAILISESVWQGSYFQTRWIPKKSAGLQGYIYPAEFYIPAFNELEENKEFVARLLSADGENALATNGKNIVLSSAKLNIPEQYWHFSLGADGSYTIMNANGFVLDVAGALDRDGAAVQLDLPSESKGQRWLIHEDKKDEKKLNLKPQYTERLLSFLLSKQIEINAAERVAELGADLAFALDRITVPTLDVNASPRLNVVRFKLNETASYPQEIYVKIYKDAYGKGSALIETIRPGQELSMTLDPGYYEVSLESGAGLALISSEVQSFSLSTLTTKQSFLSE